MQFPNFKGKMLYLKLCKWKMALLHMQGLQSRVIPFSWPPSSPDFTPTDFWLWGYVNSNVYQFHPQTVSDLKDIIRTVIQEIHIVIVRAAVLSTICHMQSVIVCEGRHVEKM